MSLTFLCPECNRKLKVLDSAAGKTFLCPSCGARIASSSVVAVADMPEVEAASPTIRGRPIREEEPENDLPARGRSTHKRSSKGLIIGLSIGGGFLFLLFVAGCVGLLAYFAFNKTIPERDWQPFSPPGTGVTVHLPGAPTLKSQTINGVTLNRYIVNRLRQRMVFGVIDADLRVASLGPNEMTSRADAERDNLILQMNGKLQKEKVISVGAIPGREFDILANDGSRLIVQLYFIRIGRVHRLCELTVGGFSVSADEPNVVRFFHSLQMDAAVNPPIVADNPVEKERQPPTVRRPKAKARRRSQPLP